MAKATTTNIEKNNMAVTIGEAGTIARALFEVGKIPYFISGPGVGKTSVFRQIAGETGRKFLHILLAQMGEVDLRGCPDKTPRGTTVFLPPDELMPDGPSLALFDELPSAPRSVTVAGLQLMDPARTGLSGRMRDDMWMACAGNRAIDRTVINTLPAPLINRICPVHVRPDLDSFVAYMAAKQKGPRIVTYLLENPDQLFTFNPKDYDGESGFGTPRSWEALADLDDHGLPKGLETPAAGSVVGHSAALRYVGYLKVYSHIPKWDEIVANPAKARVPEDNPSALFAVATLVAVRADKKTFDPASKYLERLPGDRVVATLKFISRNRVDLMASPGYLRLVAKYSGVMLDKGDK